MPCSTRCIRTPRRAAVIATRSCCGVRGASIETFMVFSGIRFGGGGMPPSAVRAPYVRYEDTNFDIHPKTAIAQKQKPAERRAWFTWADHGMIDGIGSPGWIRTTECLSQSQVPYHLATGLRD